MCMNQVKALFNSIVVAKGSKYGVLVEVGWTALTDFYLCEKVVLEKNPKIVALAAISHACDLLHWDAEFAKFIEKRPERSSLVQIKGKKDAFCAKTFRD